MSAASDWGFDYKGATQTSGGSSSGFDLSSFNPISDLKESLDSYKPEKKLIESSFLSGPFDELAVADVYDIDANEIISRAEDILDDALGEVLDLLKIPFEAVEELIDDVLNFIEELVDWVIERIEAFLDMLPFDLLALLGLLLSDDDGVGVEGSGSAIEVSLEKLGWASLGMFWDYAGELIFIKPEAKGTYQAAREAIRHARAQNQTGTPSPLSYAVDQGAEAFVYSTLVIKMIEDEIGPPIDELFDSFSSDFVRTAVAIDAFPTAVNPTKKTGPNGKSNSFDDIDAPTNEYNVNQPVTRISESIQESFQTSDSLNGCVPYPALVAVSDTVQDSQVTTSPPSIFDVTEPIEAPYRCPKPYSDFNTARELNPGSENYELLRGERTRSTDGRPIDYDIIDALKKHIYPLALKKRYPGFIGMFLYYYTFPKGVYTLEEEYTRVTDLLTWIDPDWWSVMDEPSQTNIRPFSIASFDAIDLFTRATNSLFANEVLIGSSYRNNNIVQMLRKQYPYTAI